MMQPASSPVPSARAQHKKVVNPHWREQSPVGAPACQVRVTVHASHHSHAFCPERHPAARLPRVFDANDFDTNDAE
jgi:hypothetical protein